MMRRSSATLSKLAITNIGTAADIQSALGNDWVAIECEAPAFDNQEVMLPFWLFVERKEVEIE